MSETKAYLETIVAARQLYAAEQDAKRGWPYVCVEDFILKKGRSMGDMSPFPNGAKKGEIKNCFKNAFELALETGWTYCEGYAFSVVLPLAHAWVLDEQGRVIDPTWREGKDYYGVEIPLQYATKTVLRREAYGVIDAYEVGYPLLSGEETLI